MSTRARRFAPALVLSALALVACLPRAVEAGGVDPLVPRQVVQVLDRLGLTSNGAAPSGTAGYVWTANGAGVAPTFQAAAGGSQTPWTGNIDTAGYKLTNGGNGASAAVSLGDTDWLVAQGVSIPTGTTGNADENVTAYQVYGGKWSNEGAAGGFDTLDLAALSILSMHQIEVRVVDADGIKVRAQSGCTITTPAGTTASAGYLYSNRIGSSIRLRRLNSSTTWVTDQIQGTWSIDSTTAAGFAYTPTEWTDAAATDSFSNATTNFRWRQVGSAVEAIVYTSFSGTPADAGYAVTIPASVPTMSVTNAGPTNLVYLGETLIVDASAGFYSGHMYFNGSDCYVYYDSTTKLKVILNDNDPVAAFVSGDGIVSHIRYAVTQ